MQNLKNYIEEKLIITNKNIKNRPTESQRETPRNEHPKTAVELVDEIVAEVRAHDGGRLNYEVDLTYIDVSKITNFNNLFETVQYKLSTVYAKNEKPVKMQSIDVSGWNTSKVNTMLATFYNCKFLKEIIGLDDWDVSHVKNMTEIFCGCTQLTTAYGIDEWDVSNCTNFKHAFDGCSKLQAIDFNKWVISPDLKSDGISMMLYRTNQSRPAWFNKVLRS